MSIKRVDCFTAICDWPGCGADVMASSDYSGGDMDLVNDQLDYAYADGWHMSTNGMSHYCGEHPTVWASDLSDDTAALGQAIAPAPPYLLIHDGDTDNRDDDGRVTLVRPVTEVLLDEGNVPLPDVCS